MGKETAVADDKKDDNILYVLSKGPEEPELASIAFIHATGALAMGVQARIVLLCDAVLFAKKDVARHVIHQGKPPLDELMREYFEFGGELYLCTACVTSRAFDYDKDLIPEARFIAAARYTELVLEANAVLNY